MPKRKKISGHRPHKVLGAKARIARGDFTIPSPADIVAGQSRHGGWSAMQLAEWGVEWPPLNGWRKALEAQWYRLHPEEPAPERSPRDVPRDAIVATKHLMPDAPVAEEPAANLSEEEIAALTLLVDGPVYRDVASPLIPFGVSTKLLARGLLMFASIYTMGLAANRVRTYEITRSGRAALNALVSAGVDEHA